VTEQPPKDVTIRTAKDLTSALTGLSERLDAVKADSEDRDKGLKRYGRLNRRLVVIDILLTVAIAAATWVSAHAYDTASQAADSASQLRTSTIVACQQANVARAENVQLWNHLLDMSASKPPPGQTAAQHAKVIAAFRAYVATVFKAKDCEKLYRGKP
jgi:hypothetical protein